MPDNTNRFTGRAEAYDRYRQRYPSEEVLACLLTWCGLQPSWLVADVGAGTGMLSEVFLANGNRVVAVEPNSDMRQQMQSILGRLGTRLPRLDILHATAEATTIPDASTDLVAVGRAFHWFDKEGALAEFRRILKPGGWVTLVAIDRDRDPEDPQFRGQIEDYETLLATHGTDYTRVRSGYRTYDTIENLFDGELHRTKLPGLRELDWNAFYGHTMSLSVTPQTGQSGYQAFESALRRYFDTYAQDAILTLPTTCWISAGRFREP